jgi:hypothetical protein
MIIVREKRAMPWAESEIDLRVGQLDRRPAN